jgi:sec-independent protein translocase protein TatB
MFGLTFDKLIILGAIAAFLIGPQRLPAAAAVLGRMVRRVRDAADDAKTRLRDEAGPEFDDIDWKKLDPRQYDPRRIVREALLDDRPVFDTPPAVSAQPTTNAEAFTVEPSDITETQPAHERQPTADR